MHQTQQEIDLTQLAGLTEAQRLEARDQARRNMVKRMGAKPERAHFQDHTGRAYPAYIVRIVTAIMIVLLVAFFSISAMRLYTIGSDTFSATIEHRTATLIAGVAVVIGSEAGALGFLLAAGVLARDRRERGTLIALALASTLIALVGNVQFALGGSWRGMITANPFAILEAVLPPVVVLGVGLVFERLWLDDIQRHHANEQAYRAALAQWTAATADPEASPDFQTVYMHALRAMIQRVNASGRGKTEREAIMAQMTGWHWRQLVERELRADDWTRLDAAPELAITAPAAVPELAHQGAPARPLALGANGRNGNGRH